MKSTQRQMRYFLALACAIIGYTSSLDAQTVASFNASQECVGNPTNLQSTSTTTSGSIVNYLWDVDDDGNVDATGASIQFLFDSAGVYNVRHTVTTDSGFVATIVTPVTVNPKPESNFSFQGSCVGDSIRFTQRASVSTGFIASYEWDFDNSLNFSGSTAQNPVFFFPGSGFYRVGLRVTTNEGCSSDTFQVVNLTNKPNAAFDGDNVCFGDSTSFTNNSNVSTSILSYVWEFGDGASSTETEPIHRYATFGQYEVRLTATSAPGCSDTITRVVNVFAQPTASVSGIDVCEEETTILTNASAANGGEFDRFLWSLGDGNSIINLNDELAYQYSDTGNYSISLAVRTKNGCSDTAFSMVRVNPIPVYPIGANGTTEFCEGNDVDLEVGSDTTINVLWSTGSTENSINVSTSGQYAVLLFTDANCQYRDTLEVTVNQPSALITSNDTSINNGDRIQLQVSGAETYSWTGDASLMNANAENPTVSPSMDQLYEVTATNEFGCVSDASILVSVVNNFGLTPVNLFTPDGNGQNDFWVIQNIDRYPQCEVSVYDSWGREIFSQTNYTNTWDGSLNGEPMPEGTYYYRIACPDLNQDFNGYITLLRINE